MRLEPVGPAPWLHRASLRPARPVGALRSNRWRPRPPSRLPGRSVAQPGGNPPSRSSPGGARRVVAEARCGQSCTWAECAGPQRGAWGRLGRGSLSVVPIRRPAQPSPALPVRRLLQTDWLYSWTPGGRPGPPARDTLTRGWGTLHATITTHDARARTGPAGGGAWHSLAPGFG